MRFSLRKLLAATLIAAFVLATVLWFQHSYRGRMRYDERIASHIRALATKCPSNLTAGQWQTLVSWTLKLHGNSELENLEVPKLREFENRIANRLEGKVDANSIEWIWDQYGEVTPSGATYQKFRWYVNAELKAQNSTFLLEPVGSVAGK